MLKSLLMKKERTGFPLIATFGDRVTQRCFELGTAGQRPANDYHAVYHEQLRRRLNHLFPDRPVNILNEVLAGMVYGRAPSGCRPMCWITIRSL